MGKKGLHRLGRACPSSPPTPYVSVLHMLNMLNVDGAELPGARTQAFQNRRPQRES